MADNSRDPKSETPQQQRPNTQDDQDRSQSGSDRDSEHDRIRASNDRDQQLERQGVSSRHNRGYDAAADGQQGPTDPDSAESENDRDDTTPD